MSILRRLFGRDRADRPVRGPLVVIQINFFGLDTTGWLRGLLRRRRRALAGEAPRRISRQSSFVGGGRSQASRALADLDSRIIEPSEPRGFDHGAAPVVDETMDVYGPDTAWYIERAGRGRSK
jgi:hypothetical protein